MLSIKKYFQKPSIIGVSLLTHFGGWIPDKSYLKLMYFFKMNRKLNLDSPQRFTEKLQWLKLYDHNPKYPALVDKYEVKSYIAQLIGEGYLIPTLGVWNNTDEIDWEGLPDRFVLKSTNGGGGTGVVICKNKSTLNIQQANSTLEKSMKSNLYTRLREWPYKDIPPRIIAEEYMEDENGELRDYKFYCFNGEPKVMLIASDRFSAHNFNYYDMDFNQLPIHSAVGGKSEMEFKRPALFEEMIDLSRKLCRGFAHVRVDLYSVNNRIYFGELTLYDSSGYDNLSSDKEDLRWGTWLQLPAFDKH